MSTDTTERTVELIDGYVVDSETGEVYGLATDCPISYDVTADSHTLDLATPVTLPFRVTDADSADWVLGLKMDAEAELKAIDARRAAMNENFDRMAQPHRNRLRYLEFRFDRELEAYAAANLPKGKKSLPLPHGTISFRTVKASFKIVDPDGAVRWAEAYAPEIVQKHVTKTDIDKLLTGEELPAFLEPIPERQSCSIKTGV